MARSYVSEATTTEERIGAMAAISAAQAVGFIIGPGMYMSVYCYDCKIRC